MSAVTLPGQLPGLSRLRDEYLGPNGEPLRGDLVLSKDGVLVGSGMDIAARWLAAKAGITVGATAPTWEWAIVDGRDAWTLDGRVVIDRTPGQTAAEALALACLAVSK